MDRPQANKPIMIGSVHSIAHWNGQIGISIEGWYPPMEKLAFFIRNSAEKARALFPSSCHQRLNKPPTKEGYE